VNKMADNKNETKKAFKDLKCIWMSSSVVDYKLCDKDFDCENCQFDKVIRNLAVDAKQQTSTGENTISVLDSLMKRVKNQVCEPKNIYLKNQLMVKHLFADTYYLGINPIILLFLDNINYVKDAGHQGYILKNKALFRVEGEWGYITFTSPMDFTLLDKLNFTAADILSNKWFAIISVNESEITSARISRDQWYSNQVNSLNLLNEYKLNTPKIGATLMDGGSPVKNLNRFLGNAEYLKVLSKLINE
jgi:hypothetical protein